MADDEEARKERARRLRKRIDDLTENDRSSEEDVAQRPGESDAEYVHRRMREIDRKPRKPS